MSNKRRHWTPKEDGLLASAIEGKPPTAPTVRGTRTVTIGIVQYSYSTVCGQSLIATLLTYNRSAALFEIHCLVRRRPEGPRPQQQRLPQAMDQHAGLGCQCRTVVSVRRRTLGRSGADRRCPMDQSLAQGRNPQRRPVRKALDANFQSRDRPRGMVPWRG